MAFHSKCAPWPDAVVNLKDCPGQAVCWRHPSDWRLDRKVNFFFSPAPLLSLYIDYTANSNACFLLMPWHIQIQLFVLFAISYFFFIHYFAMSFFLEGSHLENMQFSKSTLGPNCIVVSLIFFLVAIGGAEW